MKIKIVLLITLLMCVLDARAQMAENPFSKKDQEKFEKARSAHKGKKVDEALKTYCKLLDKYEGYSDLELWTGLAYKDKGLNNQALVHLLKAEKNSEEVNPLLYSTIAEVYKAEKEHDKAGEYYDQFLANTDDTHPGYISITRLSAQSKFIVDQMANPVPFDPIPLGRPINTLTSEYLPQFTADHKTIYFTRRTRSQEDIYYSEKIEDGYTKPRPLDEVNTPEYNEGAHTISADGSTFIFTHEDDKYGVGGHDLYIMMKKDGEWQRPRLMSKKINTVLWESQPSLSGDGNILFFASTRDGGYGGKDIWYSVKGKDGYWGEAKNAGSVINTDQDESSPFLHPDLRTLYFRSDGHLGMGSYDIFIARREGNKGWTTVENMGYPINTEGQEGALTVSLDGTKAYFATDYDGTQVNDHLDIYEFEMPEHLRPQPCTYVSILTVDSDSEMPIQSNLEIINIETNKRVLQKQSGADGRILVALPLDEKMLIDVSSEGYVFHSDQIILDEVSHAVEPFEKKILLNKIPVAKEEPKTYVMRNIFFASGTAELEDISMEEINRLADILKNSPHLSVKIIGHTDDVGSESDNLKLSKARAESVKAALVSEGISISKISTEGKGESQPIADNSTEQGRLQNRRTEFVLYQ